MARVSRTNSALHRIAAMTAVGDPPADPITHDLEASIRYLGSQQALDSLAADSYWPKWSSPWWHMLLLHERGQSALIPRTCVDALVAALDRLPLKIFPIRPGDTPEGVDQATGSSCHCALGCVVPVLIACGVDVDASLPWVRDWFVRYQMADGGLNCDGDAYLVSDEIPSSMVATVPPIEAVIELSRLRARAEDEAFMERAAGFLIERALTRGSASVQNAEERTSAAAWGELTFPRFYFYDVLRGLAALVAWAHGRRRSIPWSAVGPVVEGLLARFPDGKVTVQRRAFGGHMTRLPAADGSYTRREPASEFPLLASSSRIGEASPALSRQWHATARRVHELAEAGLIAGL
jgi:hypothetical protein